MRARGRRAKGCATRDRLTLLSILNKSNEVEPVKTKGTGNVLTFPTESTLKCRGALRRIEPMTDLPARLKTLEIIVKHASPFSHLSDCISLNQDEWRYSKRLSQS
jgi:hypothetical protein